MNTITIICESPTAHAFLQGLMCRKHKAEEVTSLALHPWSREETSWQAGIFKPRIDAQDRAA